LTYSWGIVGQSLTVSFSIDAERSSIPVLLDTLPQFLISKTVEALDGLPWYSLFINIQYRIIEGKLT